MNKMTDPFQANRPPSGGPAEAWAPGAQPLVLGPQQAARGLLHDFVTETDHPVVPVPFKL